MKTPPLVVDTQAMLQTERHFASARLDACDLAIANLELLWPSVRVTPAKPPSVPAKRRMKLRRAAKPIVGAPAPRADSSDAAARRELVLAAIGKSEVGLTTGELRARGPKISDTDRRNALTVLQAKGQIRRAGNAWVLVS